MYKVISPSIQIAVDYYIDNDVKKAAYFQRKLNNLALKSLNASSVEEKLREQKKINLPQTINK